MLARRAACLLMILLLVPSASAFSASHEAVQLDFDAQHAPVIISLGALSLTGDVRDGLVVAGAAPMTLQGIQTLTVIERHGNALPTNETFAHATLRIENGTVVWKLAEGSFLSLAANASYGLGLALTDAPIPKESGKAGAGALIVSPGLDATGQWPNAPTEILALHATVTILRADGEAFAGWSHKEINAGRGSIQDASANNLDVLFHTEGAHAISLRATMIAGAVGSAANMTLGVSSATIDRFADTLESLQTIGAQLGSGKDGGSPFGKDNPLQNLAPFSGVLNGALLIVNNGGDGNNTAPAPRNATMGGEPYEIGPISLMRSGDMQLRWSGDNMAVQGEPAVAVSRAGFAVAPTANIGGIIPILSVVLWIGALIAIVFFLVKRPPKVKVSWSWRLVGLGIWLIVLALVFLWWDASFADTFGTSVLTLLKAGNRDWSQLGAIFGIEMIPWTAAAVMFALPVRIMAGVGLRYLGKGASFSPVAKAGGLVALAILGPIYALWIVNAAIQQAVAAFAK